MRSRGFIKLPILLAVVFGVGFGASVFLNYQQHQRAEQDRKLMQGEIADLRYQVRQDQLALANGGSVPTPTPSATPAPEGSPSPAPSPSATPAPSPDVLGSSQTTKTLRQDANLRTAAKSSSSLVARVHKGDTATILGEPSNGYRNVTINGKTGYVLDSVLQ